LEVLTVLPTDAELFGGPWSMGVAYTPSEDVRDRLGAERKRTLADATARLQRPGLDIVARLEQGRAASVIVDTAREMGADLIIVGARGHGLIAEALLGSVSAEVVDQAQSAVLVARRPSTGRLLLGVDGSDVSMSAVAFVASSGLFAAAETRVVEATDVQPDWSLGFTPGDAAFAADVYAIVADDARREAGEVTSAAADSLRSHGLTSSTVVLNGPAASAIAAEARGWCADLIVVGTRGNGLVKRLLLGSTARSLLHHAEASVLISQAPSTGLASSAIPATSVST
jgi:nucleotide-binding universal stress UspA family protein